MKLPGTVPPNVQNVYFTPSDISFSTFFTSRSTITFAGFVRPVGGGTSGGLVSVAWIGAPTGSPKSPLAEPPVSLATDALGVLSGGALRSLQAIEVAARAQTRQLKVR